MEGKATTSLDALYSLLLEKKTMKVDDIAAHFNVTKELVIEWGKILESGGLATLSNPRIGKATISLAEYREKKPEKQPEEELPEEGIIEKKYATQKNELIKNKNQEKIDEAKKMISEAKKKGYDDEAIKKMFIEKGWPEKIIEGLL